MVLAQQRLPLPFSWPTIAAILTIGMAGTLVIAEVENTGTAMAIGVAACVLIGVLLLWFLRRDCRARQGGVPVAS